MKKIGLIILIATYLLSCKDKVEECTNGLIVYNNPDCTCPPGGLGLKNIDNGESDGMCKRTHEWMKYIKGASAASSLLNDSMIFVLNYYHFSGGTVDVKPFYFTNCRAYIQQINKSTRVAEQKIANVEVLTYLEPDDDGNQRTLIIDIRGAMNNRYDGSWGEAGFVTDPKLVPYGWNKETGEGIYLKGKIKKSTAEFYDWNIYFTPPGDSTTYEYVRKAPIEFESPE